MFTKSFNKTIVLKLLEEISDPEIPVISIVELGIIRDIEFDEVRAELIVKITPTYSGCPAMKKIENDIISHLKSNGYSNIKIVYDFSNSWTTDWISEKAKAKLKDYGIAPPEQKGFLISLGKDKKANTYCPYCGSSNTVLKSSFSSTACKEMFICKNCTQPFEKFKCH